MEDSGDCSSFLAGRGPWAACRQKLTAVYTEVDFKAVSVMLVSRPCPRPSGRSNLGLVAGRSPHLCSLSVGLLYDILGLISRCVHMRGLKCRRMERTALILLTSSLSNPH